MIEPECELIYNFSKMFRISQNFASKLRKFWFEEKISVNSLFIIIAFQQGMLRKTYTKLDVWIHPRIGPLVSFKITNSSMGCFWRCMQNISNCCDMFVYSSSIGGAVDRQTCHNSLKFKESSWRQSIVCQIM